MTEPEHHDHDAACEAALDGLTARLAAIEKMPAGPERHAALGELLKDSRELVAEHFRGRPYQALIQVSGSPDGAAMLEEAARREGVVLTPAGPGLYSVDLGTDFRRFGRPATLPTAEAAGHVLAYFEGQTTHVPVYLPGDFTVALIEAMKRADPVNFQRFMSGWPDLAVAVELYQRTEGGRDQLLAIVAAAR